MARSPVAAWQCQQSRHVSAAELEAVFGGKPLSKVAAVEALRKRCGVGKTVAYEAMNLIDGKFKDLITESGGLLRYGRA